MRLRFWTTLLLCFSLTVIPSTHARMPITWQAMAQGNDELLAADGPKQAYAYLYGGDRATYQQQLLRTKGSLNGVFLPWLEINEAGQLISRNDPEFIAWLHRRGLKAYPYLTNHFKREAGDLALTPERRELLVKEIIAFIEQTNSDGINIDLENFSPSNKAAFVSFLDALAKPLRAKGKEISAAVAPSTVPNPGGWASAYDYKSIASVVDRVIIMAYDEHWSTSQPGPVASISWVHDVVRHLSFTMPPEKIILGVPFYGRHWINGKNGNGISYAKARLLAETNSTPLEWQGEKGVFRLRYEDQKGLNELWLENTATLQAKMRFVHTFGLAGVAAWRLGLEDPDLWLNFQSWLQRLEFADTKNHWAAKEIGALVAKGLVSGSPDGQFHPQRSITRAEAVHMIVQSLNLPPGRILPFKDIPQNHWAKESLTRAYHAGLISGRPDGTLAPDQSITRGDMAILMQKAYYLKTPVETVTFRDVPVNHYAARAISALNAQGWVRGFQDGAFGPDREVTRAELATIITRTLPASTNQ